MSFLPAEDIYLMPSRWHFDDCINWGSTKTFERYHAVHPTWNSLLSIDSWADLLIGLYILWNVNSIWCFFWLSLASAKRRLVSESNPKKEKNKLKIMGKKTIIKENSIFAVFCYYCNEQLMQLELLLKRLMSYVAQRWCPMLRTRIPQIFMFST